MDFFENLSKFFNGLFGGNQGQQEKPTSGTTANGFNVNKLDDNYVSEKGVMAMPFTYTDKNGKYGYGRMLVDDETAQKFADKKMTGDQYGDDPYDFSDINANIAGIELDGNLYDYVGNQSAPAPKSLDFNGALDFLKENKVSNLGRSEFSPMGWMYYRHSGDLNPSEISREQAADLYRQTSRNYNGPADKLTVSYPYSGPYVTNAFNNAYKKYIGGPKG